MSDEYTPSPRSIELAKKEELIAMMLLTCEPEEVDAEYDWDVEPDEWKNQQERVWNEIGAEDAEF